MLALRDTGKPVGLKIITRTWALVVHMRSKRHQQRWPLPDNPHASVAMAMDAALVTLGSFEPTLSIHMVGWKIRRLTTHNHPRLNAAHHRGDMLGDMLMDGVRAQLPRLL